MSENVANKLVNEPKSDDGNNTLVIAESAGENLKLRKELSIEIFRIIRNAQKQHGLRHGDYQRYRGRCFNYCPLIL